MNNEKLQAHVKSGRTVDAGRFFVRMPAPALVCKDGFKVSVQASATHYCNPRDNDGPYTEFELGFPSEQDSLIQEYAGEADKPTDTVYGHVPLTTVLSLLEKHGGVE